MRVESLKAGLYDLALFFFTLWPLQSLSASSDIANNDQSSALTSSVEITEISDQKRIKQIIKEFESGLDRRGFNDSITKCSHIVEYRDDSVGHDYSYGAICTVANGTTYAMCNDIFIGKYTLREVKGFTQDRLKYFIQNNCPPGG